MSGRLSSLRPFGQVELAALVCGVSIPSPMRKLEVLVACLLLYKLKRLISLSRYTLNLPVANICCTQIYFHVLLVGEFQNSVKRNSGVFPVSPVFGSVVPGRVSLGP